MLIPRNILSYFNEKKNHFTSDYSLICEYDIVLRLKTEREVGDETPPTSDPAFDSAWLTPAQHPTVVKDPLRSKLGRFWRLDSDSRYIMNFQTTGVQYFQDYKYYDPTGRGIPKQLRSTPLMYTIAGVTSEIHLQANSHQYQNINNSYGFHKVNDIEFVTKSSIITELYPGVLGNGEGKAMKAFLINCFLNITNASDLYGQELELNQYFPNTIPQSSSPLKFETNGTVAANQDNSTLEMALYLYTKGIFNPYSTTLDDSLNKSGFLTKNIEGNAPAGSFTSNDGVPMVHYGAYSDAAFQLESFVSSQAMELVESLGDTGNFKGVHYADVDPVYNFLSTKYEKDLGLKDIAHTKLPNIYHAVKELTSQEDEDNLSALKSDESSQLEYFANYFSGKENLELSDTDLTHIMVDNQGIYDYSSLKQYKDNFPMSVDISFRSHSSQQRIMNCLKSTNSSADLLRSMIYYLHSELIPIEEAQELGIEANYDTIQDGSHVYDTRRILAQVPKHRLYHPYSSTTSDMYANPVTKNQNWAGVEFNSIVSKIDYNPKEDGSFANDENFFNDPSRANSNMPYGNGLVVFNFDKWLESYDEVSTDPNSSFFTDNSNYVNQLISEYATFYNNGNAEEKSSKNFLVTLLSEMISKTNLKAQLADVVSEKFRSFANVMNGNLAYNEVLYYKIEKSLNGTVLQNFWLENTPNVDVLRYVDTQIKYGVDYDYKIYAYTAVIGTKYKYGAGDYLTKDSPRAKLDDLDYENSNLPFKYLNIVNGELASVNQLPSEVQLGTDLVDFKRFGYGGDHPDSLPALGWTAAEHHLLLNYSKKHPAIFGWVYDKLLELEAANVLVEDALGAIISVLAKEDEEYLNITEDINSLNGIRNNLFNFITTFNEQSQSEIFKDSSGFDGILTDERTNDLNDFFEMLNTNVAQDAGVAALVQAYNNNNSDTLSFYKPSNVQHAYGKKEVSDVLYDSLSDTSGFTTVALVNQRLNSTSFEGLRLKLYIQWQQSLVLEAVAADSGMSSSGVEFLLMLAIGKLPAKYSLISDNKERFKLLREEAQLKYSIIDQIKFKLVSIKEKLSEIQSTYNLQASSLAAAEAEQGSEHQDVLDAESEQSALQSLEDSPYIDSVGNDYTTLYESLLEALNHELIFSEWQFSEQGDGSDKALVQVISEPFIKVVEVPVYQEVATVIDDPPLPPQVYFNQYKGKENHLLISFDNTVGTQMSVPLLFTGDNFEMIDKVRRKQDADYTIGDIQNTDDSTFAKSKITFKADDYANYYQVFRKRLKPQHAQDFDGTDFLDNVNSFDGSYLDYIAANQKHYYMFRTFDKHGHPSNPSPVYEIELVSDEGAVYLLVNVVDFTEEQSDMRTFESFQKYLQIDPGFVQTLIDENKSDFRGFTSANGVDLKLGIAQESIYDDKKFKLRISSKQTGKKLDINLTFKKIVNPDQVLPHTIL